ncbi:outer membrane protein [Erwinia billingiae]|uniref:outer membrane protein n=1 Tax=Erwinia billingiae TaxID=182337 RepID=UPI000D0035D0|nr:outer membrane beta-barrel protein [Erwinia billingiae]PRB61310.1 porin [Erwinia billingiae]
MDMKAIIFVLPMMMVSGSLFAADTQEGYYGSVKYVQGKLKAGEMDTSSRPGVGDFVSGTETKHLGGASIAAGYQYGNGWRTEGEYTFRQRAEFTSGSSTFATSFNHLQTKTERLMLNVYRDYSIGYGVSLFATAGVGVTKIQAGGWQGTSAREYDSSTQNNLTYALGAGVSYMPVNHLNIDLSYRYVDMGKVESGYNNFVNARLLKDEQMKAHLTSSEFTLGARYSF